MKMRELEQRSGAGRETIRYYIRMGLLPEPAVGMAQARGLLDLAAPGNRRGGGCAPENCQMSAH